MSTHKKFEAKITSRSQGEFQPKQDIAWYLYILEFSSSFTSVRTTYPVPLFILFPSQFNYSSGEMGRPDTCPTALKSHKSPTPLVHHLIHLILFYFNVSRPGATDPLCQAPGLCSFLANFIATQIDVRNRLVDFQCFGKGLWTRTMANHVKPENLQGDLRHYHKAMSTTKDSKPRSRVEVKVNFRRNKILLDTCIGFCL